MFVKIVPICWVNREGHETPLDCQTYYVNTNAIAVFELDEEKDAVYDKTGHIHLVNGDVIFIVNTSCDTVLEAMGLSC